MEIMEVIRRPLLTEKGTRHTSPERPLYIFEVALHANKSEVKQAVQTLFKVKVAEVRTLRVKGKTRRVRAKTGKRSDWKKAYVTLMKDQKIEALEA